jgi:hypothetical protein
MGRITVVRDSMTRYLAEIRRAAFRLRKPGNISDLDLIVGDGPFAGKLRTGLTGARLRKLARTMFHKLAG